MRASRRRRSPASMLGRGTGRRRARRSRAVAIASSVLATTWAARARCVGSLSCTSSSSALARMIAELVVQAVKQRPEISPRRPRASFPPRGPPTTHQVRVPSCLRYSETRVCGRWRRFVRRPQARVSARACRRRCGPRRLPCARTRSFRSPSSCRWSAGTRRRVGTLRRSIRFGGLRSCRGSLRSRLAGRLRRSIRLAAVRTLVSAVSERAVASDACAACQAAQTGSPAPAASPVRGPPRLTHSGPGCQNAVARAK